MSSVARGELPAPPLVARDGDQCANTRLCTCAERPDGEDGSAEHGADSGGTRSSGVSRTGRHGGQLRAKRAARAPELKDTLPTRQVAQPGQLSSSVDLQVTHVEPSDSSSCQPVDESRKRRAYRGGMKRDIRAAAHIRKLRGVFVHRKYASRSLLRHETRELRVGAAAPLEEPFS